MRGHTDKVHHTTNLDKVHHTDMRGHSDTNWAEEHQRWIAI